MLTTNQFIKFFAAALFFLFVINSFAQNHYKTYNFDFEKDINGDEDGWQAMFDSFQFSYDTISKVQGKRSIVFKRTYLPINFNLCLYNKILLPHSVNEISVSVFSKSSLLQSAWLKIAGFNTNGKIVVTDSVSILSNDWKKFTGKISCPDLYLVSIELRAMEQFKEKKDEVKLWLDDISVSCEGVNLLSMKQPQNTDVENEIAEITKNIPLTGELVLPEPILADLARKKVIGFGETVHGSLETDKFIYNNIRQLITDHKCRLVLFEMNIDRVALYNQYINGFNIDTTYTNLKFLSYEFEKFINWLKEYNATHSAKVNIAGIDLHSNPLSSNPVPPYINGFIKSFNSGSLKVDTLLLRINSGTYRYIPVKYAMDNEKELSSEFGKFNYQVLKHILLSRTDSALVPPKFNIQVYFYWQQVHRDYILWQNTKAVLKEFADDNSPVVIFAHYAHLDKVSSIHFNEVTTLGQYLNQYYGDAYCHIGVILGEGQAGVMSRGKPVQYSLESPVKGSLEYLAKQTGKDCFYRKGDINSEHPLTIRRLGNGAAKSQFIPAHFKNSMDGFVFIGKSTPSF